MSGVVHGAEVFEEVEEHELDHITEWFMTSGPNDALELHSSDCPMSHDERRRCECVPVTLQRGAKA